MAGFMMGAFLVGYLIANLLEAIVDGSGFIRLVTTFAAGIGIGLLLNNSIY